MKPHVINQGDYLTLLGERLRFDPVEIWNHPKNAQLRQLRRSPDVLCPGDVLWVPEDPPKRLPLRSKASNAYQVKIKRVKVRVMFFDGDGPLGNEPFQVDGLPPPAGGAPPRTTTAEGECTFEVPIQLQTVRISFPAKKISHVMRIGHLDPVDEVSGTVQRLVQLGYLENSVTGEPEEYREGLIALGLARFQEDHQLKPSGQLDAATQDKLMSEHGS